MFVPLPPCRRRPVSGSAGVRSFFRAASTRRTRPASRLPSDDPPPSGPRKNSGRGAGPAARARPGSSGIQGPESVGSASLRSSASLRETLHPIHRRPPDRPVPLATRPAWPRPHRSFDLPDRDFHRPTSYSADMNPSMREGGAGISDFPGVPALPDGTAARCPRSRPDRLAAAATKEASAIDPGHRREPKSDRTARAPRHPPGRTAAGNAERPATDATRSGCALGGAFARSPPGHPGSASRSLLPVGWPPGSGTGGYRRSLTTY